jgi:hypothetical protein
VKWFIRFWCLLLIPWILVAPLSGMAFIAGTNVVMWIFVVCVWTYPVSVGGSFFLLRRKRPFTAALFPAINLVLPLALGAILDALHVKLR